MTTAFRPTLTSLEDRSTPADISWIYTGNGIGAGNDPANWQGGVIPGAGDTARFSHGIGTGDADLTNLTSLAALSIFTDVYVEVGDLTVGYLFANASAVTEQVLISVQDSLTLTGSISSVTKWVKFEAGDAGAELRVTGGTLNATDTKFDILTTVSGEGIAWFAGDVGLYRDFTVTDDADLYLNQGVHVADWNAGAIHAQGDAFIRHSHPGSTWTEVDVPVSVTSPDAYLVIGAVWATEATCVGVKFDGGLTCQGVVIVKGGNQVFVGPSGASIEKDFIIFPQQSGGAWSPVELHGDWTFDGAAIGYATDAGDTTLTDLYVWGNALFSETTYEANGKWSAGVIEMNQLHVDGELTLESSQFVFTETNVPTTPPTASGEFHPIVADDIVGDFETYTIAGRYGHTVHAYGQNNQDEAVCLFWDTTTWPSNQGGQG